jgi:hypothetical protein
VVAASFSRFVQRQCECPDCQIAIELISRLFIAICRSSDDGLFGDWMAVVFLPLFEIYFIWYSGWLFALITPVAWFLLFLLVRWKDSKLIQRTF